METDWEFEVGGDAPVIDANWAGLVDLRQHPERVRELAEAADSPELATALQELNTPLSPVWTSKCDTWPIAEPNKVDPDELDADALSATHAVGCYIDLLPRNGEQWPTPLLAADWCKDFCARLRAVRLRCCRVDLVVRRAVIAPDVVDFGVTAYLTACGLSPDEASRTLDAALLAFAGASKAHSTLEWKGAGE